MHLSPRKENKRKPRYLGISAFVVVLLIAMYVAFNFFSKYSIFSGTSGFTTSDLAMLENLRGKYPVLGLAILGKSPPPRQQPRLNLTAEARADKGTFYGGVGDAAHLGGWTELDVHGISNMTWDFMIGILGVKSFMDIGCGRGYSTNYFYSKGVRVLCIEGSHAAIKLTHLPAEALANSDGRAKIVEHDFALGPYWPEETFDACWSVEFLEHVSRQYFKNYINAFKRCALVFYTSSKNGGYHHVEVHGRYWWKGRFMAHGFMNFPELTDVIRKVPVDEKEYLREIHNLSSIFNDKTGPIGQYIATNMDVLINPYVASLPAHEHLFAGEGCYRDGKGGYYNSDGGIKCIGADTLPEKYNALLRCTKDLVKANSIRKSIENMYWECYKPNDENLARLDRQNA